MRFQHMPALILVTVFLLAGGCSDRPRSQRLGPDQPIEKKSPGTGVHLYHFEASAGRYEEIEVTQPGLNLLVSCYGPNGELAFSRDAPIGSIRRELLCLQTGPGTYRLEISALRPNEKGIYRITRSSREAGPDELRRAKAFALSVKADTLEGDAALDAYLQSSRLWEAAGDREQCIIDLWRRAILFKELRRIEEQLLAYRQLVPMVSELDDDQLLSRIYQNLGTTYVRTGQLARAVDHYHKALALRPRQNRDRANTLFSLARAYIFGGSFTRAESLLEECLVIREIEGAVDKQAWVYAELGWMHHGNGRFEDALKQYRRGLQLIGEDFPRISAAIRNYEAGTCFALGDHTRGLQILDEARLRLSSSPTDVQRLDVRRAEAMIALKKYRKAIDTLTPLLDVFPPENNPADHAYIRFQLARAFKGLGDLDTAPAHMAQVWDAMGKQDVDALPIKQRAEFEARRISYAEFQLDLLVETATEPARLQAFIFAEGMRARGLVNALMPVKREEAEITRTAEDIDRLRAGISTLALKRHQHGDDGRIGRELDDLLRRYDHALTASFSKSAWTISEASPNLYPQVQARWLDQNTTLLFFAMGTEEVYLWAMDHNGLIFRALGARRDIESNVLDFHEALQSPRQNGLRRDRLGRHLAQKLLGPVADQLTDRLILIPDGALHYLPFAALPSPLNQGAASMNNHDLITLPSLTVLQKLQQRHAGRRSGQEMVVLADPEFGGDFKPLPHTRREASQIAASAPFPVRSFEGLRAAKHALYASNLQQARYLHIATRSLLMTERPELSALVLATRDGDGKAVDGFVYAHDIEALQLKTDLVVLSACSTGLGKSLRGEGLVGLSDSFLHAGSSGVVASLWPVSDEATTQLMERFYRAVFKDGMEPAAALSHAQQSMAQSEKWHAPYFWAGFIYQGVWAHL
ncbi:MAG: CHAT domain-containing protein [Acidobacteriota bacterium]|nr:CHAT domain-containing protein [Acidobacteriota bacterium]